MTKTNIMIYGLARTGTSILWRSIRKDPRFLCFDEPMAPDLHMRVRSGKRLMEEFHAEYNTCVNVVLEKWAPVLLTEQVVTKFMRYHVEYLKALQRCAANVCMKMMGCHAKIAHAKAVFPKAVHVLVVRDPRGFITSHALPNGPILIASPDAFFESHVMIEDMWEYLTLARTYGISEKTGHLGTLLELWAMTMNKALDARPDVVVVHEEFCKDPRAVLRKVYAKTDLRLPDIEYPEVKEARLGFEPDHPWWESARRIHTAVLSRIRTEF